MRRIISRAGMGGSQQSRQNLLNEQSYRSYWAERRLFLGRLLRFPCWVAGGIDAERVLKGKAKKALS